MYAPDVLETLRSEARYARAALVNLRRRSARMGTVVQDRCLAAGLTLADPPGAEVLRHVGVVSLCAEIEARLEDLELLLQKDVSRVEVLPEGEAPVTSYTCLKPEQPELWDAEFEKELFPLTPSPSAADAEEDELRELADPTPPPAPPMPGVQPRFRCVDGGLESVSRAPRSPLGARHLRVVE